MSAPEIRPRDMIAIELERDRFDTEAHRERWRRIRAERALRYAHKWCGGLMALNVLLGLGVLILVTK